MSWIESHTTMRNHKKLIALCNALQINRAEAIGHLHMLWWWTIENRENGDLTGLFDRDIAIACDWIGDSEKLIKCLHETGWLNNYHVSDWDDYSFRLLDMRRANRERQRKHRLVTRDVTGYVPPATLPNLTIIKNVQNQLVGFEDFYSKYPRKQGKQDALKAFKSLSPTDGLLEKMVGALEVQSKSEGWQKDGGKYIPLPASWIRGKRWEDEVTLPKKEDSFGSRKLVL